MSTTYEKLSSNKAKLTFDVAPEKFEEGVKKAYAKNRVRRWDKRTPAL